MGFLAGKKLLITGVLSNRSIAYGIAKACHEQGAELAFSYVGERFKDRITEFAADFDSKLVFDCDVGDDAQIEAVRRPGRHLGQVRRLCALHRFCPVKPLPATSSTA
jgi:enoyl-[acyl-carrier-protein] reductase (NADH)